MERIVAEQSNDTTSIQGTIGRITISTPKRITPALDEDGGPWDNDRRCDLSGFRRRRNQSHRCVEAPSALRPAVSGRPLGEDRSRHPRGHRKISRSGIIKGIGPTYAKRLVAAFGLETLKILSEQPLRGSRSRRHRRSARPPNYPGVARAARHAGRDGVFAGPWRRRFFGAQDLSKSSAPTRFIKCGKILTPWRDRCMASAFFGGPFGESHRHPR